VLLSEEKPLLLPFSLWIITLVTSLFINKSFSTSPSLTETFFFLLGASLIQKSTISGENAGSEGQK
jgi:hypothetical protein